MSEKTKRSTWVGIRPSVIENKRKNTKKARKNAKKELKQYRFDIG